jgi:hypothetical protein
MREADAQKLRDAGWTDRDILDIVHVCAYFNFHVCVVDGLGLESPIGKSSAAGATPGHGNRQGARRGVAVHPWNTLRKQP